MRTLQKNLALLFVILTLSLLVACGNPEEQTDAESSNTEEAVDATNETDKTVVSKGVPVRVVEVQAGPIAHSVASTSVVEAEQSVDVYPRVTGVVTRVAVEEGSIVRSGQLLCALEDAELKLLEDRARAEMEKLERDLERTKLLKDRGIVTQTELTNAQYAYDQSVIGWRQADTNLQYSQIKSTINGIVFKRSVRMGQKIGPGDQLYSVFDPRSLVINVSIPEGDYFRFMSGHEKTVTAELSSDSLPDKTFAGSIKRVAPIIDPQTNTIKITIRYEDPNRILLPGMYVRIRLITDVHENAVLIPKNALVFDDNRQIAFIVDGDVAKRIVLKPGYEDDQYIESLQGIDPGDKLITVGQNGLKNGTAVRIVEDLREEAIAEDPTTENSDSSK